MEKSGFSEQELKKFSDAGRVIAAAIGTSVETWARAEAGVILKTWAGRTKVAKPRPVEISSLIFAYRVARRVAGMAGSGNKGRTGPGQASINLGIRHGNDGKVYYRTRKKGAAGGRAGFQDVFGPGFTKAKRIDGRDWGAVSTMVSDFRANVRARVAAGQRSIGLARQSIVQIADALGIRLEMVKGGGALSTAGIAKARRALASNGHVYVNGTGNEQKSATKFFISLINRYPKAFPSGMDRVLSGVIHGRLKYFQRNLEEGTFLSAERAARAYPYVAVLKS